MKAWIFKLFQDKEQKSICNKDIRKKTLYKI